MKEYGEKRDFTRTPEPPSSSPKHGKGPLTFVIYKHAARSLHYDLRLELDGVLKSWAVPAGPSLDPKVKRLAVMVEDHPLDYAAFEGVIPEGEYGAGQVIIWDRGIYAQGEGETVNFTDREAEQEIITRKLAEGKVVITFQGQKMRGAWALVKMKQKNNWLFFKHGTDTGSPGRNLLEENYSVVSGLTIEDLKTGKVPDKEGPPLQPKEFTGAKTAAFPSSVAPMLASLAGAPFSHPDWTFEPKLDGYRSIAMVRPPDVKLLSRAGLNTTEKFADISIELSRQSVKEAVFDGEIVAVDAGGKICFQCLQDYLRNLKAAEIEHTPIPLPLFYVFDILYLNGSNLMEVPFHQRRRLLENTLISGSYVKLIDNFTGDGTLIFQQVLKYGLEGVIAKRKDSVYLPGRRTAGWLKVKAVSSDDFVVGGFTRGTGNRSRTFGALLLGQYDKKGNLIYAGRVGTGLDETGQVEFRKSLQGIKAENSPFEEKPPLSNAVTWVRPELVVEVKYAERTREGYLRAPVILKVREDKPPREVRVAGKLPTPDTGGRQLKRG